MTGELDWILQYLPIIPNTIVCDLTQNTCPINTTFNQETCTCINNT